MNAAPKQLAFYFMTATSGDYDRLLKRANLVRVQDIVNLALRYYELYAIGKTDKDKVLVMVASWRVNRQMSFSVILPPEPIFCFFSLVTLMPCRRSVA